MAKGKKKRKLKESCCGKPPRKRCKRCPEAFRKGS